MNYKLETGGAGPAEQGLDRQKILIVDDQIENLEILRGILQREFRVKAALNGSQALGVVASSDPPDIVLLDIQMPDMTGYEVCREIKGRPGSRHIPVIFVTSLDEEANEALGFELGGVDYITKPVNPMLVLARVKTQLALANQNRVLERRVAERTAELAKAQDIAIYSLSVLAEFRDDETGAHILRTKEYVRILVEALARVQGYGELLDQASLSLLYKSSPLHDIGKVGIPDSILLKPGKLSEAEFAMMKTHAAIGHEVIVKAEKAHAADEGLSFFRFAREITISHHEKWDGSGYPAGLSGQAIPLSGRIMAIADVYDALSSKRVYKPAFPHEQVMAIMAEGKGKHFDPAIFGAFVSVVGDFRAASDRVDMLETALGTG
jgi:putative two-component system response regulator